MESINQVWDSGLKTPYGMPTDDIVAFKAATGSKRVVGLEWINMGKTHAVNQYAVVLPDASGVAIATPRVDEKSNWLEVVNADGSLRFAMRPPPLNDRLDHLNATFESPRMTQFQGEQNFVVSAGYRDKQLTDATGGDVSYGLYLKIDWNTGALLDWFVQPSGA